MEVIKKAYKYRMYPNDEQKDMINQTIGSARFIYNKMLEDKIKYYNKYKKPLNNTPANYKDEYEWLNIVDSQALCQSHQDLMKAYDNFFNGKSNFPRFKKKVLETLIVPVLLIIILEWKIAKLDCQK